MEQRIIFVVMPLGAEFADVYDAIREAADRSQRYHNQPLVVMRGDGRYGRSAVDELKAGIAEADLVIADVSFANPNVLFELGFAEALGKPTLLINQQDSQAPFDLDRRLILFYDRSRLKRDLVPHLADGITVALREPDQFTGKAEPHSETKPKAFVSYSHADRKSLDRMMVHLRPLEKQGLLDVWQDTKIEAGDKWKEQINAALDESAIAVLLISADFLASDFIVDNELPPLLAAAEDRGTRILPVILKPCRFTRDKHLSVFQALNDPALPLLMLNDIEQEAVWDQLALAIENELEGYTPPAA